MLKKIENIKVLIDNFFENSGMNNRIYSNENELVLDFALYLNQNLEGIQRNRFEYRFDCHYDQQIVLDKTHGKEGYLDYVVELSNNEKIAFEFKYFTSKLGIPELTIDLKEHAASDLLKFNFRKDIHRLERVKSEEKISNGFAVLLTNASFVYDMLMGGKYQDRNYRFNEENPIKKECLGWLREDLNVVPKWRTYSSQNIKLPLSKDYIVKWSEINYSVLKDIKKNATFKYMVVEI